MRRRLNELMLVIAIAIVSGIGSALIAMDLSRDSAALSIGPWQAASPASGSEGNPYRRAAAATGDGIPLGTDEGIAFLARSDSAGEPLDGRCDYEVSGQAPSAALWTFTVYDGEERLMDNPAGRTGFHSREILRREDGSFAILVSAEPRPGNWLPVASASEITFAFRLYDAAFGAGIGGTERPMPEIVAVGCR